MLVECYVIVLWVALRCTWGALDVLIWGRDSPRTHTLDGLVGRNGDEEKLEHMQRQAWRTVRSAAFWSLVVLGYCHTWDREHHKLLAQRTAARTVQPPYGCHGRDDWENTGWFEAASFTFYPASVYQSCTEWEDSVHQSVWPNLFFVLIEYAMSVFTRPLDHLADSVGHALSSFLAHFGWFLQSYFLVLAPLAFLVALFLYPVMQLPRQWLRLGHALAPASSPPPPYSKPSAKKLLYED